MKKYMFALLLFLVLAAYPLKQSAIHNTYAFAEESSVQYAVAAQQGVYLYREADEKTGLFILPYTYYVRVLSLGDPFCKVEYLVDDGTYKKVSGFCKKEELTFVDFVPQRPYLKREITATYSLSHIGPIPTGDEFFETIEVKYLFYGTYQVGSALYYYVYGNGKFGYLPAQEEITYDLNTDYIKETSGEAETPPDTNQSSALTPTQIVFLCALGVSVVAIAVFVIRGKKQPAAPTDLEE